MHNCMDCMYLRSISKRFCGSCSFIASRSLFRSRIDVRISNSSPRSCTLSYNAENCWDGVKLRIVSFAEACPTARTADSKVLSSTSSQNSAEHGARSKVCQNGKDTSCRGNGTCSYTPGFSVTVLMHPFDAPLSYSIE